MASPSIPVPHQLQRRDGTVTNDYAPVSYNGITGWVVDLGLVATPEEVELANASQSAREEALELFGNNARVTLAPLITAQRTRRERVGRAREVLFSPPEA